MKPESTSEAIAIVGIGCQFPKAQKPGEFWSNIKQGRDAIEEVPDTHWNLEDYYNEDPKKPDHTYGRRGGFLSPYKFDPMKFGIPPNVIEATDTSQLLAMAVAEEAMDDAGYGTSREFDRNRVSVILGVTGALELVIPLGARLGHPKWRKAMEDAGIPEAQMEDALERMADSYVEWQENSFPGLLGNVVAGRVSKHLDLGGTNCVVDAACASSLSAVHLALLELAAGKSDMVLAGGVDTFNDIFMYMCFSKTPALSPTGNARPFDKNGDGTILGEGLGMVVLKRLADAERDGDRVYAVLKGMGSSSDGKGDAIYAPNSDGQMKALRAAYREADVAPESIQLVEAHGTGTVKGDAVEAVALNAVYSNGETPDPWCALGSVKSQIGHTKAAAGAAGLIKAALALHEKVLPPTIKVDQPQEAVAPNTTAFYVNTVKRPWVTEPDVPRRAAVSSFGFGGSNFHCVLEEYEPKKAKADWDGDVQLLAFSADDKAALIEAVKSMPADDSWESVRGLAKESRSSFKTEAVYRIVLVVEREKTDLPALVATACDLIDNTVSDKNSDSKDGAYFGQGTADGDVAVIFSGQGAQYPGMLRDVSCQFPQMIDALVEADSAYAAENDGARLSDRIYPHPAFDRDTERVQETELRATEVAQPAIGAVSIGAYRLLESFGVHADAFAGHSYGELTALCAARRYSSSSLVQLSHLRGKLMAAGDGDKGSMFAVRAPLADVEAILTEEKLDVVLANRNAPEQAVLSGSTEAIDKAVEVFKAKKLSGTKLTVSAAFHSVLVADAAGPLLEGLQKVAWEDAEVPVYSNTTGSAYPDDIEEAQALLANQLAKPVDFVSEIENLYAAGVRTFLEVGPGGRLTGLVTKILAGKPHRAYAVDQSNGKNDGIADLGATLARLAAEGRPIAIQLWDEGFVAEETDSGRRMSIEITGANHRSPKKVKAPTKPVAPAPQSTTSGQTPTPRAATTPTKPQPVAPMSPPRTSPQATVPQATGPLADLVRQTQENISAIQRMQEQTTALHRQYLEGQEAASKSFQTLLDQQERMLNSAGPFATQAPVYEAPPVETPVAPVPEPAPLAAPIVPEVAEVSEPANDSFGELERVLMEIVSEKTGYPVESLETEMQLDGDLGIDSIKRVEILSALQEAVPGLPTVEPERMGEIQSLGDIVEVLGGALDSEAATTASTTDSALTTILLDIVSQKTGYPSESLELEMSLDGDLGIDSIKRVEILSSLQEALPELPSIPAEDMGSLVTLGDVVAQLSASAPATTETASSSVASDEVRAALLDIVSQKTGYPPEQLDFEMSLDGDLGIDSIKRVEILSALQEAVPGIPSVQPEDMGALQTLGDVLSHLEGASTQSDAPAAPQTETPAPLTDDISHEAAPLERRVLTAQPVDDALRRESLVLSGSAEIWVTDDGSDFSRAIVGRLEAMELKPRLVNLESEWPSLDTMEGLIVVAPESHADSAFITRAFSIAQHCHAALCEQGKSSTAILASVTRMDGAFGLSATGEPQSTLAGALSGLVKTAAIEWPDVTCRSIDVATNFPSVEEGAQSVVQTLCTEGPIEIGLGNAKSVALELHEINLDYPEECQRLTKDDVVVVSGGARGVTADTAVALAEAYQCTLALLGRSAAPCEEASWLDALESEAAIKKELFKHGCTTPAEVEKEYRAIVANRTIANTVERIEQLGGRAAYYSVDVCDADAVKKVTESVESELGKITGLVHGAGVLADRLIADQTAEQFDYVWNTKIVGLQNLLAALADDSLKVVVSFSSSTARFGRSGQVAYAMANEAVNKISQAEARRRPECKVVSINWGPWAGGMVTPSLRGIFEKEGVGLIDCAAGGRAMVAELEEPLDGPVEVVITGELAKIPNAETELAAVAEFEVSMDAHPYLRSHVIDGKGVIPAALYVEWFAHGAIHGNPGLRFGGIENLRVLRGVLIDETTPRRLSVHAGKAVKDGAAYRVSVELRSQSSEKDDVLHSRADVLLCDRLTPGESTLEVQTLKPYTKLREDFYDGALLFHGTMLQGLQEIGGCSTEGIVATAKTAPRPGDWMANPLRKSWLADPLILDCAFQMMILWSFEEHGSCSLPTYIGSYRQYQSSFPKGRVEVRAEIVEHTPHKAIARIEFSDPVSGKLIARMDDYECVIDETLNEAFHRNQLAHTQQSD